MEAEVLKAKMDMIGCQLSGVHYAVLVALTGTSRTTPELCALLSGYPESDVRDAIGYLRNRRFIGMVEDESGRSGWGVVA